MSQLPVPRPSLSARGLTAGVALAAGVALVPAALAPAAQAASPKVYPVFDGSAGVVLKRGKVVSLKARYRKAARRGGELRAVCRDAPSADAQPSSEGTVSVELGQGSWSLPVTDGDDYCVIVLSTEGKRTTRTRPIAVVVMTPKGLEAAYTQATTVVMTTALDALLSSTPKAPVTVADVSKLVGRIEVLGRPMRAVLGSGPRTPVDPFRVGLWTSGTAASVTSRTPSGRLIYVDFDTADRAVSTNVLDELSDETLGTTEESRDR